MDNKLLVSRNEFIAVVSHEFSRTWLVSRNRVSQVFRRLLGRYPKWCEELTEVIHSRAWSGDEFDGAEVTAGYLDQLQLRRTLAQSPILKKVFRNNRQLRIQRRFVEAQQTYRWPLPPAQSVTDLRDLLGLSSTRLIDWLIRPHCVRSTKVDHYRRHTIRKSNGELRLIEEPRMLMKRVQKTIAQRFLPAIPLHSSVHGFVGGKSIETAAVVHSGKQLVLCMDLANFFGLVDRKRTAALFRTCGYPADIAFILACICTAPARNVDELPSLSPLQGTRLPQGSPTSPAIANAVAFRLDQRLAGIAKSVGAAYTRYADDLTFSGDAQFVGSVSRLIPLVGSIALEEGFEVNHRKTRRMFAGHRQTVLGLTVNETPSPSRYQYEELKALLYNCMRYGPETQNHQQVEFFRAHLLGRISFVATGRPNRRKKLLRLFREIDWTSKPDPPNRDVKLLHQKPADG